MVSLFLEFLSLLSAARAPSLMCASIEIPNRKPGYQEHDEQQSHRHLGIKNQKLEFNDLRILKNKGSKKHHEND